MSCFSFFTTEKLSLEMSFNSLPVIYNQIYGDLFPLHILMTNLYNSLLICSWLLWEYSVALANKPCIASCILRLNQVDSLSDAILNWFPLILLEDILFLLKLQLFPCFFLFEFFCSWYCRWNNLGVMKLVCSLFYLGVLLKDIWLAFLGIGLICFGTNNSQSFYSWVCFKWSW